MRSSATRCTCSRASVAKAAPGAVVEAGAGTGALAIGLSPNNAPRPRPNAGFAMRPECRRPGLLSIQSMGREPPGAGLAKVAGMPLRHRCGVRRAEKGDPAFALCGTPDAAGG